MKTDANQIEILTKLFYVFLYFLPTWIAFIRRPDYPIIWVLNLWLGWTGLGWIIALLWACYPVRRRVQSRANLGEIDLQEFKARRESYQTRRFIVPAVCNRCGEGDPCQCQVSEISMSI